MRSVEKRTGDIHKKLDRKATGGSSGVFASNPAWSVQNGKAPVRRNSELKPPTQKCRFTRQKR